MIKTYLIVVLVVISYQTPDCNWESPTGQQFDISRLSANENYKVSDQDGCIHIHIYYYEAMGMFNMIYEFNFCRSTVKCHGKEVAAIEALEVMGTLTENCDILGVKDTQTIDYINRSMPGNGIKILYSGGDQCFEVEEKDGGKLASQQKMEIVQRSVSFQISCSNSDSSTWTVLNNTACQITFGLNHSMGCGIHVALISYASILLIIVLVFGGYLGVGYYLNKKNYGLRGAEALPNHEFWQMFPFLVKDGLAYTLQQIMLLVRQAQGKQARQEYSTV